MPRPRNGPSSGAIARRRRASYDAHATFSRRETARGASPLPLGEGEGEGFSSARTAVSSALRPAEVGAPVSSTALSANAAAEISVRNGGVDVGLAADRRSVSQGGSDFLHRCAHHALGLRGAREWLGDREVSRHQHRPRPSAKILGRDVAAGDLPKVGVDVARRDRVQLLLLVEILQKILPGQLLAGPNDPRHAPVAHRERPLLAALARELETNLGAFDRDVVAFESGQPIALIVSRIFVIADADQRRLQKMHDRRQNLLARQPAQAHVLSDRRPDRRQRRGEFEQVLVFRLLARLAIFGVILVLLAPFGVAAGRLNVPVRCRADPDVGPCRRDDERAYAFQRVGVRDPPALRIEVDEALARAPAPDCWPAVAHVAQPRRRRHVDINGNMDLGIQASGRPHFSPERGMCAVCSRLRVEDD